LSLRDERDQLKREKQIHTLAAANGWLATILDPGIFGSRSGKSAFELVQTKFYGRSHDAVIRVYDAAVNVMETHEHAGDFREW
jgi:hypothetical protein